MLFLNNFHFLIENSNSCFFFLSLVLPSCCCLGCSYLWGFGGRSRQFRRGRGRLGSQAPDPSSVASSFKRLLAPATSLSVPPTSLFSRSFRVEWRTSRAVIGREQARRALIGWKEQHELWLVRGLPSWLWGNWQLQVETVTVGCARQTHMYLHCATSKHICVCATSEHFLQQYVFLSVFVFLLAAKTHIYMCATDLAGWAILQQHQRALEGLLSWTIIGVSDQNALAYELHKSSLKSHKKFPRSHITDR